MSKFDLANLRLRVLSALVLAPLVLAAVYLGGCTFAVLIALATTAALWEWLQIINPKTARPIVLFACASLALLVGAAKWIPAVDEILLAAVLTIALFFLAAYKEKKSAFWTAFGIPYIAGSGCALVYLRAHPDGLGLTSFLLAVVWGTDIGAYAAGRIIGGPKLAPRISPKKTWAGLFGGMALAVALGYSVAAGFGAPRPLAVVSLCLVLAVVAQIGDLFKSAFKRKAGVKDSGQLIPGHGGVLDRIDGLIFASLFLVLFEADTGAQTGLW